MVEEDVVVDLDRIQVGIQVGEAGSVPGGADTVQVVFGARAAVALLVGEGGVDILERAGGQILAGQPAQADTGRQLHIVEAVLALLFQVGEGAAARLGVIGAHIVDKAEHIAPNPATGVLEGEGGLGLLFFVELTFVKAFAVQVGQAVVLPEQWAFGEGLLAAEQGAGQGDGVGEVLELHRFSLLLGMCCNLHRTACRGEGPRYCWVTGHRDADAGMAMTLAGQGWPARPS